MDAAAFSGDYTDLKFIKTRKVAVISVEIPIEQAAAFVAAFGTPNPAEGVPVAIARMETAKTAAPEKPKRSMQELPLPQQAALLCDREAFWRFLEERLQYPAEDASEAAKAVRDICCVGSRAQIQPGTEAGAKFTQLQSDFSEWFRAPILP